MSDTESNPHPKRTIRSFVKREGRLTPGQQRAIDELWSSFGIDIDDNVLDFEAIFGRTAPITLEVGYGNGESLVQMAKAAPERDFIGIEVHRPGVGRLLHRAEELGLTNLRTLCADAVVVLKIRFPMRVSIGYSSSFPIRGTKNVTISDVLFLMNG